MTKNIVFVGVGAVGTFLAAFLAQDPENTICLCDLAERMKEIEAEGLSAEYTLQSGEKVRLHHPASRFTFGYNTVRDPDLIIVGTKSFDLQTDLIRNVNNISGPHTHLLFTQVGLPDEVYQQFSAPSLVMIVNMGVNKYGATSVLAQSLQQIEQNKLPIGVAYNAEKKQIPLKMIEDLFTSSGLRAVQAFDDIGIEMYKKIMVRLSYGLLTVPDSYIQKKALSIGELDTKKIKPIIEKINNEVSDVARSLGYGILYTADELLKRVNGLDKHYSSTALDAANQQRIETSTLEKVLSDAKKMKTNTPRLTELHNIFLLIDTQQTQQTTVSWERFTNPIEKAV